MVFIRFHTCVVLALFFPFGEVASNSSSIKRNTETINDNSLSISQAYKKNPHEQLSQLQAQLRQPQLVAKFEIPDEDVSKPTFCNKLDCPTFDIILKTEDFEERLYRKSMWVSTQLLGIGYESAQHKMFMKLFNYISGGNVKKEKIAMTAPVIDLIIPGPGPACENNFTMSFFISSSLHDPPQPSDESVYFTTLPQQRVFVRSYGGFATKSSTLQNAIDLGNSLAKKDKRFQKDFFYSAGYDSPFKIFERHNEVWYLAEN